MNAAILLASLIVAQVNTEKLRSWDREGFSGNIDFALTWQSGNVGLLTVATGLRIQFATLRDSTAEKKEIEDLIYLVGNLQFGERRNVRPSEAFINNGFAHLRWTRMWLRWIGTELFGQAQYNEFIKLRRRLLGGAGVRFEVIRYDNAEVHVGTAYMLEAERLDVPEGGPDESHTLFHRWSSYLSLKLYLAEPKVALVNTAYIQPRFADFSDYRFIDDAEISVAVTDAFAVVWAASIRVDSQPPQGIEKVDTTLTNNIRFVF